MKNLLLEKSFLLKALAREDPTIEAHYVKTLGRLIEVVQVMLQEKFIRKTNSTVCLGRHKHI